jgi:DMSO/TMAO reductase YedYZ molybdopterin-dependent catalytic subunit
MVVGYIIELKHNGSQGDVDMKKAITGRGILGLVLVAILVAAIAFAVNSGREDAEVLAPDEIREYEGEDLSSVNAFRENSIKGPQEIDVDSYALGITGLVTNSTSYTYNEVLNGYPHYRKVVTLDCVEGWSATILWEGVLVRDLLAEAGPLANAEVIIFHAYDGYTTSLPIDYITDNDILMAYKMNDVVLPPERGFPFQLVAESKWGYKWIKWITEIELSDDVDYRGYWESRGYSNSADLDESPLGDSDPLYLEAPDRSN